MHCRCFDTAQKGNHSSFLTPTVADGRRPLPSEICARSDPSPSKNADFDTFLLTTSQPYKILISTIMINRKSTTIFPTSYRLSTYVSPKSPKGWLRKEFNIKFNFIRIKSATASTSQCSPTPPVIRLLRCSMCRAVSLHR